MDFQHAYIRSNGVTLHTVQAGPEDGPLLILLHGFPEFWYGWRRQIPFLAQAGYRVWAPDQRGYNLSQKPPGVAAYNLDELAADVVGLIDAAGREKAIVVGHDWGGAVAWWLANKQPERLEKVVALNAPHHAAMRRTIRHSPGQRLRSLYILFFQIPWLPEILLRAGNGWALAGLMQASSRSGAFSPADVDVYRRAWSQPGALAAMLHWYRAIRQARPQRLPSPRITVPTLLIWGARDVAFNRELAPLSVELCDDGRLALIEEASHWVQHEEAERVNHLIHGFISPVTGRQSPVDFQGRSHGAT